MPTFCDLDRTWLWGDSFGLMWKQEVLNTYHWGGGMGNRTDSNPWHIHVKVKKNSSVTEMKMAHVRDIVVHQKQKNATIKRKKGLQ